MTATRAARFRKLATTLDEAAWDEPSKKKRGLFYAAATALEEAASGTLTEGGDAKQAPGESLSGPTLEEGDA